jgi:AcrR family transcriptional regulator
VEVIDDLGWAHASTNRIAKRAGVSIGSLYQYFRNKETILSCVFDRHRQQVHAVVGRSIEELGNPSVPFEIALRQLFERLLEVHLGDPALTRVLSTAVPHLPPAPDKDPEQLTRRLREILDHRPDIRVRDPDAAAHVLAVTTEALTRWLAHEAPDELEPARLIDEMVTMLSAYLGDAATRPGL